MLFAFCVFALKSPFFKNKLFEKILFIFNLFIFRDGKAGRKRGRETLMYKRNIHWLPLTHPHLGTRPVPGMCSDRESNQQPVGLQASTQSTEPHQPGHKNELLF